MREILRIGLIMGIAGVSGYVGSELHRQVIPTSMPVEATPILPGYPGGDKFALDVWDRYQLTNDRLNRFSIGIDTILKEHDRKIKELEEHTGVHRPQPTPKPRPTASDRLKPGGKP